MRFNAQPLKPSQLRREKPLNGSPTELAWHLPKRGRQVKIWAAQVSRISRTASRPTQALGSLSPSHGAETLARRRTDGRTSRLGPAEHELTVCGPPRPLLLRRFQKLGLKPRCRYIPVVGSIMLPITHVLGSNRAARGGHFSDVAGCFRSRRTRSKLVL